MKILLIEDDLTLSDSISEAIGKDYLVDQAVTMKEAFIKLSMNVYDLVILDISLPDGNGIDVCYKVRQKHDVLPILVLTGENNVDQKVSILNSGADDYLTKPFDLDELKARIHALLRRSTANPNPHTLKVGDLTLDLNQGLATQGKQTFKLRKKEMMVLEYLMRNAGKVVTRERLFQYAWEGDSPSLTNTITVHIKYLRDRIDSKFTKKMIKTIHGWGYKIDP